MTFVWRFFLPTFLANFCIFAFFPLSLFPFLALYLRSPLRASPPLVAWHIHTWMLNARISFTYMERNIRLSPSLLFVGAFPAVGEVRLFRGKREATTTYRLSPSQTTCALDFSPLISLPTHWVSPNTNFLVLEICSLTYSHLGGGGGDSSTSRKVMILERKVV